MFFNCWSVIVPSDHLVNARITRRRIRGGFLSRWCWKSTKGTYILLISILFSYHRFLSRHYFLEFLTVENEKVWKQSGLKRMEDMITEWSCRWLGHVCYGCWRQEFITKLSAGSLKDREEDQVSREKLAQHHQTWATGHETNMVRCRRTCSRQEWTASTCGPMHLWRKQKQGPRSTVGFCNGLINKNYSQVQ